MTTKKDISKCSLPQEFNDFSFYIDISTQNQVLIDFLFKLSDRFKKLNKELKASGKVNLKILRKIAKNIDLVVVMKKGRPVYFISERTFMKHFDGNLLGEKNYGLLARMPEYKPIKIAEYKDIKAYSRLICKEVILNYPCVDMLEKIGLGYMLEPGFK